MEGYDYRQHGAYSLTICTQERVMLFGDMVDGVMNLNTLGCVVDDEWRKTPSIRAEIHLDEYVVMPNHFHAIVYIIAESHYCESTRAHSRAPLQDTLTRPARSLGSLVAGFKATTTAKINKLRETPGSKIWQRNYYERIIRNEDELNHLRQYITLNPQNWLRDNDDL
jgi:REP element-mobilizing transposase RayT